MNAGGEVGVGFVVTVRNAAKHFANSLWIAHGHVCIHSLLT